MHLIENYQPSQPHGWPRGPSQTTGMTIGGHTPTLNGQSYRMSVRPLAYAATPSAEFTRVLNTAFGRHYSFRYAGGSFFEVQSYNVFAHEGSYGADLFVVHVRPRHGAGALRFIQVVSGPEPFVDNGGSANPWYAFGGTVSILGTRKTTFYYEAMELVTDKTFAAEVFLVAFDRDVVTVFGGLTYGWQVRPA